MSCTKIPEEFLEAAYPKLPSLDSAWPNCQPDIITLLIGKCVFREQIQVLQQPVSLSASTQSIRRTRSFAAVFGGTHERLETGLHGPDLPSRNKRAEPSRDGGSSREGLLICAYSLIVKF